MGKEQIILNHERMSEKKDLMSDCAPDTNSRQNERDERGKERKRRVNLSLIHI